MLESLGHLRDKLGAPEFLTLVLEPVLFWGPFLGLLAFLVALVFKESKSQKFGLLVIVLSCATAVPLAHVYGLAVGHFKSLTGAEGAKLVDAQLARLDQWQYGFLAVAALAVLALFLGKGGKAGLWLTVLTVVATSVVVVLGLWLFLHSSAIAHPGASPGSV